MKKLMILLVSCVLMCAVFSLTAFSAKEGDFYVDGLDFVKGEQDSVTFRWNGSPEADFYYVYQYNKQEDKYKLVLRVNQPSATISNLEGGTSYFFRVLPMKYENGTAVSGEKSQVLTCVTAPKGDLVIKTKGITYDSITLKWNKIPGATGYKVMIYDKSKKKFVKYKATKETSITVTSLKKNRRYSFKVASYRWKSDALAYGKTSNEYKEFTHTDGVPKSKSQIAKAYNDLINGIKQQKNMTVRYEKEIDTEMLSCTKENLALTVKNTLNLYEGRLVKKHKFISGRSGAVTPNSLFEPYGALAAVEREDIASVKVWEKENGYNALFVLKSDGDNAVRGSHCDGALSLVDPKSLNTTPLKIKNSDTYFDKATISFSVRNGKLKALKIKGNAMSDVSFQVSTVSADTLISYSVYEYYKVS